MAGADGCATGSTPDIEADFSSAFSWYLGTDGNTPAFQVDFMSVVLHELAHGLGFVDSFGWSSGSGSWGLGPSQIPVRYDQFVINFYSQSLINDFPNNSTALASQLTSKNIYWIGANGIAANGGTAPRLYAPNPFEPGSSIAHLNETTYPGGTANSLMTPVISYQEAVHDPGPVTLGMFRDMGWMTNGGGGVDCNTYAQTLWSPSTLPATAAHADAGSYEIGVKFSADVDGNVCGIRFYKGTGNVGTHVGRLWAAGGGSPLASATFTGETSTGWQQVLFSSPVAITAGTTYVASYSDPNGHFAWNGGYFAGGSVDRGNLHAPSSGNAVVGFGAGTFPTVSNGSNYWVDVVFTSGLPPPPSPNCSNGTQSLWSTTTVPSTPAHADTGSYEIGVKFRADVSGHICGVRFYKGTGNTGTHIGRLWPLGGGSPLAFATFAGETASGWQTVLFNTPVAVTAGTTYVASYSDPNGRFAWDGGYFATSGVDSKQLHAPSSPSSGGNAVVAFGAGNFPTVSNGSNYWVDVVFASSSPPPAPSCGSGTQSLWAPSTVPGTTAHPDENPYTLGIRFTSDVPGQLCGVRFYKGASNTGIHYGHLWSAGGALLSYAQFTGESATGWQTVTFSSPVTITAGIQYIASYSDPSGHFAWDGGYFSGGPLNSGHLHAPTTNGMAAFGVGNFPTLSNGSNYWVDVVFIMN